MRASNSLIILAFAATIVACSGGGAGGSKSIIPAPEHSSKPGSGEGVFTIHVPAATQSSASKHRLYVSPATESVSFQVGSSPVQVITLGPSSSGCQTSSNGYTCTASFSAPVGEDTVTVETFASTNGTGDVLSMNTVSVDIVAGQLNAVDVVLNGVVNALSLSLAPSAVSPGVPSTVQATWSGLDASGYTIIGPGSLVDGSGNVVAPTLTSSNSTDFTIAPQPSPSPGWSIAYDGSSVSSPTLTLAASGANPAIASVAQTLTVTNTDWDTFGYDLAHNGYYPYESTVGVSNVGSMSELWTANVGSGPMREPVLANGVTIGGQSTNVLYAGSNWGSELYAINAATGSVIWKFSVPSAQYTCAGSSSASQWSIGMTPAIDRAKNLIYFGDGENQVHALNLSTGVEASGWPIASIADYTGDHNFMHGAFTYNPANGYLYVVTSSTCDLSPWYGRVVAINTSTQAIVGTFYPVSGSSSQGGSGGGVWGPGGVSIDTSTNDVYIATGNADTATGIAQNAGDAEQIVELTPTLSSVIANNYPPNIPSVTGDNDFDFGATPLLFQPSGCPALLAAQNKSGMFELYDRSSISSGPVQFIQMTSSTDKGNFQGMPAYDPVTNYVYVGIPATYANAANNVTYEPGLAAFSINSTTCTLDPTPVWSAQFGPDGATASGETPRSPITIANGVVYVSNYTGETEYAFNAQSGAQLWSTSLTGDGTVGTIVSNGVVYVGNSAGAFQAWSVSGSSSSQKRRRSVH